MNTKQPWPTRAARWSTLRRTALLLVTAVVSAGGGAAVYFLPALRVAAQGTGQSIDRSGGAAPAASAAAGISPDSATPVPRRTDVAASSGQPFTILLLGSDNGDRFQGDQVLTQSMILARIDLAQRKVTMLSIPRDLYVPLSTGGTDKIDKAYLYGGPSAAVTTVERALHVHVDHYAWIGLRGLIKAIDLVGGVDVVVTNPVLDDEYPNDLGSANPFAPQRIALMPGPQHLDGAHALEYVRSRHDDLREDFGRSERQQQVLVALREKATELNLADAPAVAQALSGEFTTDLSIADARSLLPLVSGFSSIPQDRIILEPPATQDQMIDGQDVLVPDWSVIRPIVAAAFG